MGISINSLSNNQYVNGTAATNSADSIQQPMFQKSSNVTKAAPNDNVKKNRMNDIMAIIKEYKLSPELIMKLLTENGNVKEQDLLNMDDVTFEKLKTCLKLAIKDCIVDGKVDEKKFSKRFIGYKINIIRENLGIEEAKKNIEKFENQTLMDVLKEKNPNLAGKNINEISVLELKDALKKFIKERLSDKQLEKYRENPETGRTRAVDYFIHILGKCEDAEKTKIFQAFAYLLKDEEMQEIMPELYSKTIKSFVDSGRLTEFIEKVDPKFLETLGLTPESINIIKTLRFQNMNDEQLQEVNKKLQALLDDIDSQKMVELQGVLKKLTVAAKNGQEVVLDDKEQALYDAHKEKLNEFVLFLGGIAGNKVATADCKKLVAADISQNLKNYGLSEYVYKETEKFIETHSELFEGKTTNEVYQILNDYTQGAFAQETGIEIKTEVKSSETKQTSSGFGFANTEAPVVAITAPQQSIQELYAKSSYNEENKITVEKNNDTSIQKVTSPFSGAFSVRGMNESELREGIKSGDVKFSDALNDYNNLASSGKKFVDGLIKRMNPVEQAMALGIIKGSSAVKIIKHTGISTEKLNLKLNTAAMKALEKLEQERESGVVEV